jgi:hypothetical protein
MLSECSFPTEFLAMVRGLEQVRSLSLSLLFLKTWLADED